MNSFQRLHGLHSLLTVLVARSPYVSRNHILDVNGVLKVITRRCNNAIANQTDRANKEKVDYVEYFKNLSLHLHGQTTSRNTEIEPNENQQFEIENSNSNSNNNNLNPSIAAAVDKKLDNSSFHLFSNNIKPETSLTSNDGSSIAAKEEGDIELSHATTSPEQTSFNPLAKGNVTLDDIPSIFPSSFNLAAYVVKSSTLQQLVKLGVDLSRWDTMEDVPSLIVKLDFEKDIKPYIQFLTDIGVPPNELGKFLTKNPLLFKFDIDDLQVRINYLESKKFTTEAITRIVTKAPHFLTFSTKQIDHRLGYFQTEFQLTGDEVRSVVTRFPKLAIASIRKITEKQFSMKEEMGFRPHELKSLLLNKPKLWLLERRSLLDRFNYIHNEMEIPHNLILQFPGCLLKRKFAVKERHLFLKAVNRAQYDPKKEGYVSLKAIVSGSDADFCEHIAKTSLKTFNDFLKTL